MAGPGQFLISKEAQAEIEKQEQLKRIGHSFIRVLYTGRYRFPRFHGFHNLGIVKEYNPDTGLDDMRAVSEDRVVEFQETGDGRFVADVLDDEHNRFTISRHLDLDMAVDDPDLANEIAALTNKPYSVEPDRKTKLLRERERIDSELAAMGDVAKVTGRRPRRTRRPMELTADVPPPVPTTTLALGDSEGVNGGQDQ